MNLYERLIEEAYGKRLEDLDLELVKRIQCDIQALRKSYRTDAPVTPYEEGALRKAYMLAYYPHYMEVAQTMMGYVLQDKGVKKKGHMHLAYFAAGPGPEILGSIQALMKNGITTHIQTDCLDLEEGWEVERSITKKLIKEIRGIQGYHLNNIAPCDMRLTCKGECMGWSRCKVTLFRSADIYFMNNCINHLGGNMHTIDILQEKIEQIKSGAYFIITDLPYESVRVVLKGLEDRLQTQGKIIASCIQGEAITQRCNIPIPSLLEKKIFIGKDGLIGKKSTRYYYLIFKKD
nr:hypothetical protein [uncultured Niameybacter sp.]